MKLKYTRTIKRTRHGLQMEVLACNYIGIISGMLVQEKEKTDKPKYHGLELNLRVPHIFAPTSQVKLQPALSRSSTVLRFFAVSLHLDND